MTSQEYYREWKKRRRARETPEERATRLEKRREDYSRKPPTQEQKATKSVRQATRRATVRASMSEEQLIEARAANAKKARDYRAKFPEKAKAAIIKNRKVRQAKGLKPSQEQTRSYSLKYSYGITTQEWEELFASQESKCAICGSAEPHSRNGWATDHCHSTGKVRGILCQPCNTVVHKRATPEALRAAATYLEEHQ